MDDLLDLQETPIAERVYMLAGWRQWADAGATSSALPEYLINHIGARKIGEIRSDAFYLFQLPGAQQFLRPEIKLEEGRRTELKTRKNELFFAGDEHKGLVIFLGDEPHLNVNRYAQALFDAAQTLRVRRIAAVGGVYNAVPYDKDREIICTYSLPQMKEELTEYAVRFSNYEGGVSIGSYLADRAERLGIEYLVFYALVPMYDLSQLSPLLQGMVIEQDFKAWYDLMRRFNFMFRLGLDLADLERRSHELVRSVAAKIELLDKQMPQLHVREHLAKLTAEFVEMSFMPLDDVWKTGLKDLFEPSET